MPPDTHPPHATGIDAVAQAERTAFSWIDTVAECLGTSDRTYAFRLLWGWLHTVRDRLEIDGAAHLGAQLPLMLRGIWYDGWRPSVVPVEFGPDQLVSLVADAAGVDPDEARRAIPLITTALDRRWAPGQTDHLLAQLPASLRELMAPDDRKPAAPVRARSTASTPAIDAPPRPSSSTGSPDRVAVLEHSVATVVDALDALLHGLEVSVGAGTYVPRAYRVLTGPAPDSHPVFPPAAVEAVYHAQRILAGLRDSSASAAPPAASSSDGRAPGPATE